MNTPADAAPRPSRPLEALGLPLTLAIAWTVPFLVWSLGSDPVPAATERFVDDLAALPFRAGIAILALMLGRRATAHPRAATAWRLLGLSVGISALTTLLRVLDIPLPALASIALAIPQAVILLTGLWQLATLGQTDSVVADWIDAAAIVIALFLLGSHYVAGGNPFDSLVLGSRRSLFLIFLITDGTAVLFLATAWFRRPEGLSRDGIGLVTLGFGTITLSDLVFDQQAQLALLHHGGARDVMVLLGFLLLFAGVDLQRRRPPQPATAHDQERLRTRNREFVAPVAIVLSTVPMLNLVFGDGHERPHLAFHVIGVVVLLVLVLIRQHLARERSLALARERAAADARFRSLVQRSSDAILQVGADHVIQWASPSASELAGTIPSLLVGRRITELAHPDDRDRLTVFLANASQPFARNAALRWRMGRQGAWHDVESVVTDLTADLDVHSYVLNTRNVTERVRLEQQLRQAQKLEAVGRLSGGIAHDFNNILAAIISHAQLVREELPADDPRGRDLLEIEQTAQRGAALTRRLLSFSRPESGETQPQSLPEVLRGIEPMLRRLLMGRVALRVDIADEALRVRSAEGQLEQILMNLVINARDAMPDGGEVVIEARALTVRPGEPAPPGLLPGRWVELAVRDEGIGMDAATLERLFEPFFTTKPTGLGTGLGLSTVRAIVRAIGGHCHAESAVGEGTTMRVHLPQVAGEAPAAAAPEPAPAMMRTGAHAILVVDDEAALRSAMVRLLERSGFAVREAAGALDALALLAREAGAVDLVVTDMVMPGMSGREFVRRLQREHPALPVLCMSGHMEWDTEEDGDPDAPWCRERLIAKPFAFPDLLERIRAALDPARATPGDAR